jgi:hypothetical protein
MGRHGFGTLKSKADAEKDGENDHQNDAQA